MKAATFLTVLVVALGAGVALTSGRAADQTPTPVITSKPLPSTKSKTATFAFTDTDLAATFECSLDGNAFSACLSPKTYSSLQDGTHTFSVRAIDQTSTEPTSESASYTWTIDTVAPPPPAIQGPPNPTNSTSATFVFSDSEAGVTFGCRLDGSGFPPCASPTSFAGPLADGEHTLRAKAVDAAGNASAAASVQWTIDTVAPAVPSIGAHAAVVSTASTTFTFSSAGASGFQCRVDAAAFVACVSGASFGPFADGLHTFFVRAVDAAGNASAVASFQWTIDTVVPVVTLTQNPPSITNQTSASFAFSSTTAGRFECALDAPLAPCGNTSPVVYTGLADGSHTFSVRAVATNTGTETKYTWMIDTVAPETTITSNVASSGSRSVTFAFTSSEAGSTFVCSLDGGGLAPCESPKTYAGLGDGTHAFTVQAVDAAGNTDASAASSSWQIRALTPF